MRLEEIIKEAKENQSFTRLSNIGIPLVLRDNILLTTTSEMPVLQKEDFEAEDWDFVEND